MNNKPKKTEFKGNLHKIEEIAKNLRLQAQNAHKAAEELSLKFFLNYKGVITFEEKQSIEYFVTEEQVYNRVADQIMTLLRPDEVEK